MCHRHKITQLGSVSKNACSLGAIPAQKAIIGRGTCVGRGVKGAAAIGTDLCSIGVGGYDGVFIVNGHIHRQIGLTGITGVVLGCPFSAVERGDGIHAGLTGSIELCLSKQVCRGRSDDVVIIGSDIHGIHAGLTGSIELCLVNRSAVAAAMTSASLAVMSTDQYRLDALFNGGGAVLAVAHRHAGFVDRRAVSG